MLAAAGLGCAQRAVHQPVRAGVVSAGAPRLTIRVLDHLVWPFRLSRVAVAADGTVLQRRSFVTDRAPLDAITLPVVPGEHTVQFIAETRVQVTPAGPDCAVTLRTACSFVAGESAPVELEADLYLRDRERPFDEQLRVRTEVRGALPDPWIARAPADEARCAALAPLERAICRVEANLAVARRGRDIIRLVCNQAKLEQMVALGRLRDEARARLAGQTDGGVDPAREADRVRVAEQRATALGFEADRCVGEELAFSAAVVVAADDACFAAGAPDREPDRPFGGP